MIHKRVRIGTAAAKIFDSRVYGDSNLHFRPFIVAGVHALGEEQIETSLCWNLFIIEGVGEDVRSVDMDLLYYRNRLQSFNRLGLIYEIQVVSHGNEIATQCLANKNWCFVACYWDFDEWTTHFICEPTKLRIGQYLATSPVLTFQKLHDVSSTVAPGDSLSRPIDRPIHPQEFREIIPERITLCIADHASPSRRV